MKTYDWDAEIKEVKGGARPETVKMAVRLDLWPLKHSTKKALAAFFSGLFPMAAFFAYPLLKEGPVAMVAGGAVVFAVLVAALLFGGILWLFTIKKQLVLWAWASLWFGDEPYRSIVGVSAVILCALVILYRFCDGRLSWIDEKIWLELIRLVLWTAACSFWAADLFIAVLAAINHFK